MGRKIISLLLLLVMTIESIGFTVVLHLCSSAHEAEINSFNGFTAGTGQESCCCADLCHDSEVPVQDDIAFEPVPCCTNVARYIKLESDFYPPFTFSLFPFSSVLPVIQYDLPGQETEGLFLHNFLKNPEHSPPLHSNRFLISVHQLKIAGPCCFKG